VRATEGGRDVAFLEKKGKEEGSRKESALGLAGHRFEPRYPMHGLTGAIDEGICPEILEQRIPVTQPLGTRALLLLSDPV
jgi:hypothetical protein